MSTRTRALDTLVYGVDVQSGDVRGDRPSYALVTFDGESIERDVVTHRKLRRLIESEEPDIVATDNMYELAADKDALVRFLGSLPDATRLVQVTGDERPEPLSRVAKRHGVPYGKPAIEEAEAAARLAARNVGYEVSAFTDETTVKVSRGRSTGKGGWSQDRYTRRIHGNVKRETRDVESKLDDAGLDYERDVTEKYGGFSNAVFTVEARPQDIPVSNKRAGDVRVTVERVRRDGIEFEPLAKRRDRVLVGVDPGTTTAVALVDLDGHLLDVLSTRTADTADVIEWIVERGRPVLVAADVTPMPATVDQIRRSFDAAGWHPENDLPVDEKQHRTREEGYDNDHERDAMAAALYAHDAHADQIRRITRKVPPRVDRGEVVKRVLSDDEPVEAVVDDLTPDEGGEDDDDTEHEARELSEEERTIKRLRERVARLDEHVTDLEDELDAKDARIADLEGELEDARREERKEARERREVTRLEWENDRLEDELEEERERADALAKKLERLKELWKLDHSNFADVNGAGSLTAVKPVAQFTLDAIETADEEYGLARGDVVYFRDASGAGRRTAEALAERDPRVVLLEGETSDVAEDVLYDADVPFGSAEGVEIREIDELAIARDADVAAVEDDYDERAERREQEETESMVDSIISEHRADRE
ncbi:DUF460 domain-containing protein [Halarchaeum sp. CBA1220]|uniref:DUF460 domain-containing protein n=1 Tax=Halarchaeum sp. CBA1220 TaxID=1853682 RepID=UPI000F3A8367|nr:DUF460 domain-containing protein [Halarchaeum sp. CBA1220]QLC33296.1 DUF460 domain-containing protein [Halarchaeum sp. CBA1220]